MTQRNTYFQDEVVKEEKIDVKNLRRLLKYVVPHKKMFCIVLALMLVAVASSLISPLILKVIINQAIPNRDHAQLALALGGIAVCGGHSRSGKPDALGSFRRSRTTVRFCRKRTLR